jgi:hypothetical protein
MKVITTALLFSVIYWTGASLVESLFFKQATLLEALFHPEIGEIALRCWVIALIFLASNSLLGKK